MKTFVTELNIGMVKLGYDLDTLSLKFAKNMDGELIELDSYDRQIAYERLCDLL